MSDLESRVLGPIELDGGAGGGAMERDIPFAGSPMTLRLEIDFPDRLTQASVDEIDAALENLDIPDRMAREAIRAQLGRDGTAPAQLYAAWGGEGDPEEFVGQLRPTAMTFAPDGGKTNPYPLVMHYGLADGSASQQITVRMPSRPTGPEIDRSLHSR